MLLQVLLMCVSLRMRIVGVLVVGVVLVVVVLCRQRAGDGLSCMSTVERTSCAPVKACRLCGALVFCMFARNAWQHVLTWQDLLPPALNS